MKVLRTVFCCALVAFLLFTPAMLVKGAQTEFKDARFVRKEKGYQGTIVLYHIVRQRPYAGSLTKWLSDRAEAYEKKHRGTHIAVEGMDEAGFSERLEYGRSADAYSFFSGSVWEDLLLPIEDAGIPYREGLFQTERCVPYAYSGYTKLKRSEQGGTRAYYGSDITAARLGAGKDDATEEQADELYLDLRRAGDLIRYKDGFASSVLEPIDNFTDAVCWLGIDRRTDEKKAEALFDFFAYLQSVDVQQGVNTLGLLSVRADVRDTPPEALLKPLFKQYATVETIDPFRYQKAYDSLCMEAASARAGDADAAMRFMTRLNELKE